MPKPFVLIQVEDSSVSETTIVGVEDMVSIIVDWDCLDDGFEQAQELIDEIVARYPNEINDDSVAKVVERLEEYAQSVRDEEEEEECDEEDEDEDEEECEELAFDDEDELDLNENFKQVD